MVVKLAIFLNYTPLFVYRMKENRYNLSDICHVIKYEIFSEKSKGEYHANELTSKLKEDGIKGMVTDSQLTQALQYLDNKHKEGYSFHYLLNNGSFRKLIQNYRYNRERRLGKIFAEAAVALFVLYQILSNYITPDQQKQVTPQKATQGQIKEEKPAEESSVKIEADGKKGHTTSDNDYQEIIEVIKLYENDKEMKDKLRSIRRDVLKGDKTVKEAKEEIYGLMGKPSLETRLDPNKN